MLIIFWLFSISAVGIILSLFRTVPEKLLHLLVALWGGTMLSVSLVHILPESLGENSLAIYAFVAGFLTIYLLEELLTPHHHDHHHWDHTHEDPHEHLHHVVIVSWIAIFLHTIFDGVSISAGLSLSRDLGMSILLWVAVHQIPVSLSLASLLKKSQFWNQMQIFLMCIFSLAAPLGYILSNTFIGGASIYIIALTTAFAGGSLLYVSNVELLPIIHAQSDKKMKYITVALFVFGTVGMSLWAFFE